MIKFFGTPLEEIKGAQSGKVIFRFDHKGEFITDDEKIIARALGHFDHIEMEAKETGQRVKKTIITPPIQITTADTEIKRETDDEPKESFICKYCGESFDTFGKRQRHYMTGCPKKG